MKTSSLILIFCIFILTSATVFAQDNACDVNNTNNESNPGNGTNPINVSDDLSFSQINLNGEVFYVLDHTGDLSGGNWITMGNPSSGRRIQLPQPIAITYSGPKFAQHGGVFGTLSSDGNKSYAINYPSAPSYTTLPIYLPGENVNMSFFGASALEGNVSIYVFNLTAKSASGILKALSAGNIENLESTFHNTTTETGNHKNYSAVLGENGDLSNYDLGSFDPGQYCIVMVQRNGDGSRTILSAIAFVVAEYDLQISAPASIIEGSNLDINMGFNDPSGNNENTFGGVGGDFCGPSQQNNSTLNFSGNSSNYTYGAVLINEQAYKANIEINSNGTINSTSILINGEHFTDKFDINASNYKSMLTKNELQKEVQALIGEGNGSLAISEVGQEKLSLATFDLPAGSYYLFVGAYDPKGKIAGLKQQELEITSANSNNTNNNNDNNNNNNNDNNYNNGNENNNNANNDTNNNANNNNNNDNANNDNNGDPGNGGSGGSSGSDSTKGSSGSSSGSGSIVSPDSANNSSSGHVPSGVAPQNEKGAIEETGSPSQKDKDGGISKIASFFIGLLAILLAGALILKKMGHKQEK